MEVREIELKNFNPMVWNLILKHGWLKDYVQVKIDFLGYPVWINVKRRNGGTVELESYTRL